MQNSNPIGKWIIGIVIVVMAFIFFPYVHDWLQGIDMTGTLPIVQIVTIAIPFIFVGIAVYIAFKNRGA